MVNVTLHSKTTIPNIRWLKCEHAFIFGRQFEVNRICVIKIIGQSRAVPHIFVVIKMPQRENIYLAEFFKVNSFVEKHAIVQDNRVIKVFIFVEIVVWQ
jgi:hypothetical protein